MVLGLFQNVIDAEIALNNLSEADFNSQDISVIMEDIQAVKRIADVSGALTGTLDQNETQRLQKLGFTQGEVDNFQASLKVGGVIISIKAGPDSDKAAQEILADQKAQNIKVINEK